MQSPTAKPDKISFATMDAVRGVAALCVMLCHYPLDSSAFLFPGSSIAVDIFFCLSGFVLCHSYEDRLERGLGAPVFFELRLIRLYPLYILGAALGMLAYGLSALSIDYGNSAALTIGAFVCAVFMLPMLQNFTADVGAFRTNHVLYPMDGPAWSLFFELFVNVLFALYRPRGRSLVLLLTGSFALFAYSTALFDGSPGWSIGNFVGGFPRVIYSFYLGFALYHLWKKGLLRSYRLAPFLAPLMVLALCALPSDKWLLIGSVLLFTPMVVALSVAQPASEPFRRFYALLGEASYPVYVLHLPAYNLMALGLTRLHICAPGAPPPFAARVTLVVVVCVASIGLARLYDQPGRRWLAGKAFPAIKRLAGKPFPTGGREADDAAR